MKTQPKALYLINFISMWEYFSYYGMRALLILFMIHAMQLSDENAFSLYALYTSLLELGGVVGGLIADRFLGLKRSIMLGGWTIVLGHLCLALPQSGLFFYIGLALIVAGTSLFRSNVAAFLGEFYEKDDPRRDAGYTLYYTGINIGGFLASILCGFVGEYYGWHAGFSLAALGMLAGNIALVLGRHILQIKEQKKKEISYGTFKGSIGLLFAVPLCALMLYKHGIMSWIFPVAALLIGGWLYRELKTAVEIDKGKMKLLLLYTGLLILFYGCEEQLGSTLVLFAERHVDLTLFSWTLPASSLITFNPLTILIVGPLLSRFLQRWNLEGITKIAWSFALLGGAFILLYISCLAAAEETVSLGIAIGSILLIALGEIFIGPTVYAAGSEAAPEKFKGATMGIVTLGYALANLFSGFLSQLMAVVDETSSLMTYANGFALIGYCILGLSALLLLLNYKKKVFAS